VPEVSTLSFGALLKRYRRAANLTQESLAERAGISARSVSDLERGLSRAPHAETIALLAQALGLTGSERVAFLAAAHPQPTTAAAALKLPPLPTVLSPLIAREREEAALMHLLQRDAVRLLTVTGPAGVGKTRLALQVAQTAQESFTDGVVFVSLAAIREPRLVALAIAQALGLQEHRQQQAIQILIAALRERHMLLVLDNCEQVPGAAGQLLELLAHAPRLKVLATSRARWRIRGEQVFPLAPLAVPDLGTALSPSANQLTFAASSDTLSELERQDIRGMTIRLRILKRELEQHGAVALFLQRVRALQPDFQLSAAQAPVIAELCARLDGLPLAIELAAARFPLLPPQQLLDRLGTAAAPTALRVVAGQLADLPERHQSLRAAIGWSYELLKAPEQRLFRRLSMFAGGAALEAILAVCADAGEDESQLLERLEALLAQSLVRRMAQDERRFDLLETIREYGLEQLAAAGEEPALRARFASFMLALAERETQNLTGPGQVNALAHLSQETGNLRAALRWLQEQDDPDQGLQLAGALWRFWLRQGALSEGRDWLERLLARAEQGGAAPTLAHARASYGAGVLAAEQGDYARAIALAGQCTRLAEQLGDQQLQARALNLRGNIAKYQGEFAQAAQCFEASLALFRGLQENASIAMLLNNLATLAQERGDYTQARTLQEESLALKRGLGDQRGMAVALLNLGDIARDEGRLAEARARAGESLALFEQLADEKGIALALNNMGEAAFLQGDYEQANVWVQDSLKRSERLGDQWAIAVALHNVGRLAWVRGDAEAAERAYHQSLQVYVRERSQPGIVECLEGLIALYATTDPLRGARFYGLAAGWRERTQTPLPPVDAPPLEQVVALLQAALGKERFAQAVVEGQALSLEEEAWLAIALPFT
jgi:predicted ATPase/DNA-binding XRE family transcriptional regulator